MIYKNTEKALADSLGIKYQIKQLKVGKYNINYLKTGKGKPLVLIHGGNIGWGQWYPNLKEFSKHFTVYALDMPGGGRSTRVDFSKVDFEEAFADTLDGFMQKLKLRGADVIGSSVGGWAAIKVALRDKNNIGKLVLVNPVGFSDYSDLRGKFISIYPMAQLIAKLAIKPSNEKAVEEFIRDVFYSDDLVLSREFIEYFFETTQTSHNLLFISRIMATLKQTLLTDELPKLKNETLIIWGDKDTSLPLKQNKPSFKLIENREVIIMKNCGHIPLIEKPEKLQKQIISFLK